MWENEIHGDGNAKYVFAMMVYMNALYFALRGGKEHRKLWHQPSQIALTMNHEINLIKMSRKFSW